MGRGARGGAERAHHPAGNAAPGWDGTGRELRAAARHPHAPPARSPNQRAQPPREPAPPVVPANGGAAWPVMDG